MEEETEKCENTQYVGRRNGSPTSWLNKPVSQSEKYNFSCDLSSFNLNKMYNCFEIERLRFHY